MSRSSLGRERRVETARGGGPERPRSTPGQLLDLGGGEEGRPAEGRDNRPQGRALSGKK
jgi:hypothetical protein